MRTSDQNCRRRSGYKCRWISLFKMESEFLSMARIRMFKGKGRPFWSLTAIVTALMRCIPCELTLLFLSLVVHDRGLSYRDRTVNPNSFLNIVASNQRLVPYQPSHLCTGARCTSASNKGGQEKLRISASMIGTRIPNKAGGVVDALIRTSDSPAYSRRCHRWFVFYREVYRIGDETFSVSHLMQGACFLRIGA
jgi:hypothetical protein